MENRLRNIALSMVVIGWIYTWIHLSLKNRDLQASMDLQSGQLIQVKDQLNRSNTSTNILLAGNSELKNLAVYYQNLYSIEKMKPARVVYIQKDGYITADSFKMPTTLLPGSKDSLPLYRSSDSSRWHRITVLAGPDSTQVAFWIKNEFVTWHQKLSRWYEPDRYQITTLNLNPKTVTTEKTAYQLKAKRKYRGLWLLTGLAAGMIIAK